MSLIDSPHPPQLLTPGGPFLLTAIVSRTSGVTIAASYHPGGQTYEFAIGGVLAEQVLEVDVEELPIALCVNWGADGWGFDYLGGPEHFAEPPIGHTPPTPRSVEELHVAEQKMLRESLGIPADQPIPAPAGPLPPAEQPDPPESFDPTPHMDLSLTTGPDPVPTAAPPGPEPSEAGVPAPPLPPPARPLGSYGDRTETPFAH